MIKAQNIGKSFGSLEVLKGIDLQVAKAEVVCISGASGAGKSTLLQILGTLMRPDSGSVSIDGIDPFSLNDKDLSSFRNSSLGFVFQSHRLLPEFSAVENVMIPALIGGRGEKQARKAAEQLLEMVGLAARMEHRPGAMSGGEQQRVAIARALVNSPAVLLADEPSGNLDSTTKAEIHKLFFDLRNSLGQTTLIVTHDESLAAMCDRNLRLRDGRWE